MAFEMLISYCSLSCLSIFVCLIIFPYLYPCTLLACCWYTCPWCEWIGLHITKVRPLYRDTCRKVLIWDRVTRCNYVMIGPGFSLQGDDTLCLFLIYWFSLMALVHNVMLTISYPWKMFISSLVWPLSLLFVFSCFAFFLLLA